MPYQITKSNQFHDAGAAFSDCRQYRYVLWRIWDDSKPLIMFIGLNPSNANEDNDDPTIRKVVKFAKDWRYGSVVMCNLFAFVTPYPKVLKECADPLGDNDNWLIARSHRCKEVIFAWGKFDVLGRDKFAIKQFPEAKVLMINKDGSPRHPLYVPGNIQPTKFE
jgi:hypothetical protein